MAKEAATPEAPPTLETPVSPETILEQGNKVDYKSVINPDGTFTEKWKDTLPEDIRGEKCLDTVTDFNNAIKQLVSHKKMVGVNKVAIPNEKSKPEEWNTFYEAAGRPKIAEDYKVEVLEDLKDLYPAERIKAAKELAHSLGVNQKQFAAFMKHDQEQAVKFLQDQDQAEEQAKLKADEELHKEFGAAYTERIHVANRLIAEAIPNEEQKMAFLEKYANDPDFIRFASVVGARMTESKAMIATLTTNTPGEAQAKIRELQNKPGYMKQDNSMSKEERESITAQLRDLHKQAYPEKSGR